MLLWNTHEDRDRSGWDATDEVGGFAALRRYRSTGASYLILPKALYAVGAMSLWLGA